MKSWGYFAIMRADRFRFDGEEKCRLNDLPTDAGEDKDRREEVIAAFPEKLKKLSDLQNVFYADKKEGLIIVLQALDAAGKDSLIRHVASGMNPQGVHVSCFKRPSAEELSHDYLWRVNNALPRRGEIAIFNRSYYEDIITAKVHHLKDTYEMADRVIGQSEDDFIDQRIHQVKNYESYLYENSYRVVKVFLNVSKDEQKKRFLERIDREDKNWKFNAGDLDERDLFDEYKKTFESVITKTSTKESPWYALPADDKWYTRDLFADILIKAMEECHPVYPMPDVQKDELQACRERLLSEDGGKEKKTEEKPSSSFREKGVIAIEAEDDDELKGDAPEKLSSSRHKDGKKKKDKHKKKGKNHD